MFERHVSQDLQCFEITYLISILDRKTRLEVTIFLYYVITNYPLAIMCSCSNKD